MYDESAPEGRANRRRATWTARKTRLKDPTGKFDRDYWLSRTPEERGQAVWNLTVLAWEAQGIDITELRLDRTTPWTKRRLR
jgi:hypothetical protein